MPIDLTPDGTRGARIPGRLLRAVNRPMMAIYRLLRGRGIRMVGQPLLILTTTGAKSGRQHSVPLIWFADGEDRWLIVASRGGAAQHPAWYVNMAKHPDQIWIQVGGRRVRVQAESLRGAERTAAWQRITATAGNYAEYQTKTDREIPVVRLRPAELVGVES